MGSAGRDRKVWIAEDLDEADDFMLTGRFSGHFERGRRLDQQFEGLSAEQAITWGRVRAAVVLIRTGTSDYYSAGSHNPDPRGVRAQAAC